MEEFKKQQLIIDRIGIEKIDWTEYDKLAQATVSLYDFLGKAAGTELGKEVYDASVKEKEPVNVREIKTKRYNGKVMLYRKEFLNKYFKHV